MRRMLVLAACLALAGCNGVQKATDWMASPTTTKAANNAAKFTMAVECGLIVPGAQLSQQIAAIVKAGDAAIDTTGKVYAVSEAVCTTLTKLVNAH